MDASPKTAPKSRKDEAAKLATETASPENSSETAGQLARPQLFGAAPPPPDHAIARLRQIQNLKARQTAFSALQRSYGNQYASTIARALQTAPPPILQRNPVETLPPGLDPAEAAKIKALPIIQAEEVKIQNKNWTVSNSPQKPDATEPEKAGPKTTSSHSSLQSGRGQKTEVRGQDKNGRAFTVTQINGKGDYSEFNIDKKKVEQGDKVISNNETHSHTQEEGGEQHELSYQNKTTNETTIVAEHTAKSWQDSSDSTSETNSKKGRKSSSEQTTTKTTGQGDRKTSEVHANGYDFKKVVTDTSGGGDFEHTETNQTQKSKSGWLPVETSTKTQTIEDFSGKKSTTESEKKSSLLGKNSIAKTTSSFSSGKTDSAVSSSSYGMSGLSHSYNVNHEQGIKGSFEYSNEQDKDKKKGGDEASDEKEDKDKKKPLEVTLYEKDYSDPSKNKTTGLKDYKNGWVAGLDGKTHEETGKLKITSRNISADYAITDKEGATADYSKTNSYKIGNDTITNETKASSLVGKEDTTSTNFHIGQDGVGGQLEHREFAGVKGGAEAKTTEVMGDTTVSAAVGASGMVGIEENYGAGGNISLKGLTANAHYDKFIGAKTEAHAKEAISGGGKTTDILGNKVDKYQAEVNAQVEASVGARANLDGEAKLDAHGGSVKAAGGIFAGGEAKGSVNAIVGFFGHNIFSLGVEGRAQAGVGAQGEFDCGFRDGKFHFKTGISAAAGLGLGGGTDVSVDFNEGAVVAATLAEKGIEKMEQTLEGKAFIKWFTPIADSTVKQVQPVVQIISAIPGAVSKAANWAGGKFNQLLNSNTWYGSAARQVRDGLQSVGDKVTSWGQGASSKLGPLSDKVIDWVRATHNRLRQSDSSVHRLGAVIKAGLGVVKNWDAISGKAKTMVNKGVDKLKAFGGKVKSGFDRSVQAVQNLGHKADAGFNKGVAKAESMGAALKGKANRAVDKVSNAATSTINWAQQKISSAKAAIGKLKKGPLGAIASIAEKALSVAESLVTKAKSAAQAATQAAHAMINKVSEMAKATLEKVKSGWQKLKKLVETTGKTIKAGWEKVKQLQKDALQAAKAGLEKTTKLAKSLASKAQATWDGLKKKASSAWDGVKKSVSQVENRGQEAARQIQQRAQAVQEKANQAGTKVRQGYENAQQQLDGALQKDGQLAQTGKDKMEGALKTAADTGQQAGQTVYQTIKDTPVKVQELFNRYGQKATKMVKGAGPEEQAKTLEPAFRAGLAPYEQQLETAHAAGQQAYAGVEAESQANVKPLVAETEAAHQSNVTEAQAGAAKVGQNATHEVKAIELEAAQAHQHATNTQTEVAQQAHTSQEMAENYDKMVGTESQQAHQQDNQHQAQLQSETAGVQGRIEGQHNQVQQATQSAEQNSHAHQAEVLQKHTATEEATNQHGQQLEQEQAVVDQETNKQLSALTAAKK